MSSDSFCFIEQSDFSVRFARCASPSRPLRIEELTEFALSDVPALIAKIDPSANVVCALRPKPSHLHLATVDEAKRYSGATGVRTFVGLPANASSSPAWLAAAQASDGATPGGMPWLVSTASAEAYAAAESAFTGLKVKSRRNVAATFSTIGAVASTATKPVLVLEIGELVSHAFLVAREGVIGARAISLNLDQIAGAVQAELNLKFRGSAAKLFFNVDYDFTDTSAKIVGRMVDALKSDLAPLFAGRTPAALYCSGLPATQSWFGPQLAAALNLSLHTPDFKAWSDAARVTFATPELAASLPAAWLGLLHLVNSSVSSSNAGSAWQAEWSDLSSIPAATPAPVAQPASVAAAPTPAAPSPAPKPAPQPAPAVQPAVKPTPAPAAAAKPVSAPVAAAVVQPAAKAAAPAAKPAAVTSPAPAPQKPAQSSPSSVSYSAKPTTPEKSASKPVQKKSPEPVSGKPAPAPASPSAASLSAPSASASAVSIKPPARKNNMPLVIGAAALVLMLLVGGFFVYSQKQESARLLVEKQRTEERLRAEEEKARIAQKKAQEEAENRKQVEAMAAQKLAQSESAREQAENEARTQAAARLANARGTLVVTTEPAGASVKVGDLPPRMSPATFADIKIGKYPVSISLARYGTANVELEVRENATTESGVIALERVFGSLELKTGPAGVDFELHPANALMVAPDARRTGRTPATITDLPPDNYAVTFSREGWAPHTETVSVAKGAMAHVEWILPNGAVHIISTPAGASVTHAGVNVGTTPLLLADQRPGDARYEVALDGFDPVTLDGKIVAGSKLELAAEFPLADRFYTVADVDQKPEASNTTKPDLPYYLTLEGGRIEIDLVVNRDGTTRNLRVAQSSNPDFGKYCLAAVAKWKFKPGIKGGKPVNVRMSVPLVFPKGKS